MIIWIRCHWRCAIAVRAVNEGKFRVPLGIKPTVDFAFKRIFGGPENVTALVGLLNAILELANPIVHVEILNPFSYQEFADDKLIVLDIRARDSAGRWLNIEMQVSVFAGLLQRLVYYACTLYTNQLAAGQNYVTLRPAMSICLLRSVLFPAASKPHHRFRLMDQEHGLEIPDSIEVHTVELTKYNLSEETIGAASPIEQWAFFFLFADRYEAERLRDLLPGVSFQRAIEVIEAIAAKTEDRMMYDQREKAQRDLQWQLDSARQEGREEGREEGLEVGALVGQIQAFQQLLGEDPSSAASLLDRPTRELSQIVADLQQRLRARE